MILPLLVLVQPQRAEAMSWADLWSRPDQQAQAALDAGDAKEAQALARDPQLRGSAAYRANDYAAAAQDFDRRDNANAQYNLGILYEGGHGVAKNAGRAREWYRRAAEQAHDDAKQALERLDAE